MSTRKPLPDRRAHVIFKTRIDQFKVHLTCGEYKDGSLGEIFIDCFKTGSQAKAWSSQFSVMVSLSLQYGTPLSKMVSIFRSTRFSPMGMCVGDEEVRMCTSILDWVFRKLEVTYLNGVGA